MKNMLIASTALGAAIAGIILMSTKKKKNRLVSGQNQQGLPAGQEARNPIFSMG